MNFIQKINQFLIERYPTVWNTKLVWMLIIAALVHSVFFTLGYFAFQNPEVLQEMNAEEFYLANGIVLVNIIISLLMLVGWLVLMFKNNAFKNFYPLKSTQLFAQFLSYFVIILASTTFYFSYILGAKSFTNYKYSDVHFEKNVTIINKAYPFLLLNDASYYLNNRLYPEVFSKYYVETDKEFINFNQPNYRYKDNVYQYFELYNKVVKEKDEDNYFLYPKYEHENDIPLVYKQDFKDSCVYYFRKNVVNMDSYIKTADLSIYNFSEIFYHIQNKESFDKYYNSYYYPNEALEPKIVSTSSNEFLFNKSLNEILDRSNDKEIKKILNDFLEVSNQYQIKNNLKLIDWFDLVYHPKNFVIKGFIASNANDINRYEENDIIAAYNDSASTEIVDSKYVNNDAVSYQESYLAYSKKKSTGFYYEISSLKKFLNNVETIKKYDFFSNTIQFYLWLSFAFTLLIFCFRVTNLKTVIFSGIAAGVLSLFVGFIGVLSSYSLHSDPEVFLSYFVFILGVVIISIPILFASKFSKLVSGIALNLTICGIVPFLLLVLNIISIHQNNNCYDKSNMRIYNCSTILDYIADYLSLMLFIAAFIFMFFYTIIIKKWRALPE